MDNIVAALDNPKTLRELKQTASMPINSLQKSMLGGDVEVNLRSRVRTGFAQCDHGLGELFGELYPAKTER